MARRGKQGFEYFPFDVDFFNDLKIRKLIRRQGGKAVTVYACLLCNIYKCGYYMRWDDELPFYISELTGFEDAYIRQVINDCFLLGLFDGALYKKSGVITSKGVQERYSMIYEQITHRKFHIDEYEITESHPQNNDIAENCGELRKNAEDCGKLRYKGKGKEKENKIPPINSPNGGNALAGDSPGDDSGHVHPAADAERSNMPPESANGVFTSFISDFNRIRGSKFKPIAKAERQFGARLKEGFTAENMLEALQNAMKARNHIESAFKYLTPEFFTRPDKIEMYSSRSNPGASPDAATPRIETGECVWIEGNRKFYGDRNSPIEIPLNAPGRPDRNHFYNPRKNTWEI